MADLHCESGTVLAELVDQEQERHYNDMAFYRQILWMWHVAWEFHKRSPRPCLDSSQVTVFYAALFTIQIVSMQLYSQVKSSHLYLYSAFNNTDCVKALNSIKLEDRVSVMYNNKIKHSIFS